MKQTLKELSTLELILEKDKKLKKWNGVIRNKLDTLLKLDYTENTFRTTEEELFKCIYHCPDVDMKPQIVDMYLRCWEAIYLVKKNYKED